MDKYEMLKRRLAQIVMQYEDALIDAEIRSRQIEAACKSRVEDLEAQLAEYRLDADERKDDDSPADTGRD